MAENLHPYIHFIVIDNKPKTAVWSVRNNKTEVELGQVKWYAPWRQYCFIPARPQKTIFNATCLRIISEFIETEMTKRKAVYEKSEK